MSNPKSTKPSGVVQNHVLKLGDRFVDSLGAAEILDTPPNTLNYWRCVGRGPKFYRQGRNVRYLVSDLLAWGTARAVDPEKKSA
jgi:hypothetical protein